MATLTNTRIRNTYDGLLKTTDNDALGGTYKLITDGLGNSSNIYLGTGGNLGIGIIPTEKFHVNGDAIVSGDLHVDAIKPIASSNPIKFKNFASTELVRITDSGNVGIGETDPSKPLTINKNQSETAILVQSSDTGLSGIYLGGQSDSIKGGLILDNSDNSLQLRGYNNANRLHINSSGNVGIGTTNPTRELEVTGAGNVYIKVTSQTDNDSAAIELSNTQEKWTIANSDTNDDALEFKSDTSGDSLVIKKTGAVGIGTSSPDTILEVVDENPILTIRDTSTGLSSANSALRIAESGSGDTLGNYWDLKMKPESIGGTTNFAIANSILGDVFNINYQAKVGIGTSSPSNGKLQIDSTSNQISIETGTSGDGRLQIGHFSNGTFIGTYGDDGGAADIIRFGTHSGDERMRIDSSGNVGIGTSSPSLFFNQARNLVVGGSGNIGATIYSSNSGNTFLAFADVADGANSGFNAGGSIYYEHANDAMAIRVNGSERMRIDSSGNVGIGETSPHSFGSGQSGLTISDGVGGCIRLKNDAGTANFDIENGGGGGTNLNSVNAFPLRFSTNNTERMRIDSSGNVGIGTSNPGTFKLDVAGSARSNFFALRLNQSLPSESSAIYRPATGTFAIVTSAAERMRIDANGKVGIGTNQPQTLLQLSNNNSSTNTEQGAISFAGDTASRYSQISGFRFNNSNQAGLDFKVYNGALNNAMRITNTGDVGIGTTNISEKFEVVGGDVNGTVRISANESDSCFLTIGASTTETRIVSSSYGSFGHLTFYTGGSEKMRIDSSGNVGIGTTSPDVNFQVGDGTTDAISRFYFNDNTYTQINGYGLYMSRNSSYIRPTTDNTKILYIGANTKQWNVLSMDASATLFNTNGSENMRITNTGAVGIGTTNPSANLHVYGNGQGATIRSLQAIGLEVQGGGNGTDIAIFKNTSGTEKFSLNTSGQMFNLGMASSSSANASLMHNSSTGLIYRYTSSIRYKEDVKDLTNAVDKIMKLRPVEFKPKDSLKYTTGMIAEEVFEVMPEITFKAEIEGFDEPQVDGISYEPMHAYYIKAIQEQQEMINELKSDIETLKSQINS